jgi:phage-related protein
MPAFTWKPYSATKTIAPRVRSAVFGDGYAQRMADGINSAPRQWQLVFQRPITEVAAIDAFLQARAGYEAFDWTDVDGVVGRWVCSDWSVTPFPGLSVSQLSATFLEEFGR